MTNKELFIQMRDAYRVLDTFHDKVDFLKLHCLKPDDYPVLLQSVSRANKGDYFDILFVHPRRLLTVDQQGGVQDNGLQVQSEPWDYLQQQISADHINTLNQSCSQRYPFHGGWFAYFSYEANRLIEPVLQHTTHALSTQHLCVLWRFEQALLYDHARQQVVLFSYDASLLNTLEQKILSDYRQADKTDFFREVVPAGRDGIKVDPDQDFLQALARIQRYIVQGDVFQVNLSRQWQVSLPLVNSKPHQLAAYYYHRLRQTNPAPFSALARLPRQTIISSSPERLLKVSGNWLESRPIAGTHPRGGNRNTDQVLQRQLHQHPKERSEHIMLIDLIRNDLGRVCRPGSIEVNELMTNESYQFVHHIVSNVRGRLKKDINSLEIIRALFPGGTITGCPKVRCMQIIDELEQQERGAYTGSLGYINDNGEMDLNILIRTMVMPHPADQSAPDKILFRAGAGIVADSVPAKELAETMHKARGMLQAIIT